MKASLRENELKEDLVKTSFQKVADSSGHLVVKRSPINVAKKSKKLPNDGRKKSKQGKGEDFKK